MAPKMKQIVEIFFKPVNENTCKCLICPDVERKKSGSSWANIVSHLTSKHPDFEIQAEKVLNGGTLDKYVDFEGGNYYRWVHQIIFQNLPFSFVDEQENRIKSTLKPISSKGLKNAIHIITRKVEQEIAKILFIFSL